MGGTAAGAFPILMSKRYRDAVAARKAEEAKAAASAPQKKPVPPPDQQNPTPKAAPPTAIKRAVAIAKGVPPPSGIDESVMGYAAGGTVSPDGNIRTKLKDYENGDKGFAVNLNHPKGKGSITGMVNDDNWMVGLTRLDPRLRGQGHGTRMYLEAAKQAAAHGKALHSGSMVDKKAARVWESLHKHGYEVTKHKTAKFDGPYVDHEGYYNADGPVFTARPAKSSRPESSSAVSKALSIAKAAKS